MKGYVRAALAWFGIMAPLYALIGFISAEFNPMDWHGIVRLLYGVIGFWIAIPCAIGGYENDP